MLIPMLRYARRGAWTMALLGCVMTPAAGASDDADSPEAQAGVQPGADRQDFLFARPEHHLGVSGGELFASSSGGIFEFAREQYTVGKGAFDTPTFRVAYGRALSSRLEVLAEVGRSNVDVQSEYRDFVDFRNRPIVQTTSLAQTTTTATLRVWLVPRGREVGRFAWVPTRVSAYVGAGGGANRYRFSLSGDFVDFVDYSVQPDHLESSGWTASAHLLAGTSVNVFQRLFLIVEARYVWAGTPLSDDFVGFENLDLNGMQVTSGIEIVF